MAGEPEEAGARVWPNGDVYVGNFSRDKMHGQGELLTKDGKYTGNFKDGIKEGLGSMGFIWSSIQACGQGRMQQELHLD